MGLVEDAPVGGPAYEVEHQVLPLGRPVGKDRAAVDGPQGGDALTPGMQLPKACTGTTHIAKRGPRDPPHMAKGGWGEQGHCPVELIRFFWVFVSQSSVYSAGACGCSEQDKDMPSSYLALAGKPVIFVALRVVSQI